MSRRKSPHYYTMSRVGYADCTPRIQEMLQIRTGTKVRLQFDDFALLTSANVFSF